MQVPSYLANYIVVACAVLATDVHLCANDETHNKIDLSEEIGKSIRIDRHTPQRPIQLTSNLFEFVQERNVRVYRRSANIAVKLNTEQFLRQTFDFTKWSRSVTKMYPPIDEISIDNIRTMRDIVDDWRQDLLKAMQEATTVTFQSGGMYHNAWPAEENDNIWYDDIEKNLISTVTDESETNSNITDRLVACERLYDVELRSSSYSNSTEGFESCVSDIFDKMNDAKKKLLTIIGEVTEFKMNDVYVDRESAIELYNRNIVESEIPASRENIEWLMSYLKISFTIIRNREFCVILSIPVVQRSVWTLWRKTPSKNVSVLHENEILSIVLPHNVTRSFYDPCALIEYRNHDSNVSHFYTSASPFILFNQSVYYDRIARNFLEANCIPIIYPSINNYPMRVVSGPYPNTYYVDENSTHLCELIDEPSLFVPNDDTKFVRNTLL